MSIRLFAAITPPADVVERLIALQRGVAGAIWRPAENLHLTLRFFGEVAEPVARDLDAELEAEAQSLSAFTAQLAGAGFFGKEAPHSIWIGVKDPGAIKPANQACERAARRAGLKPEPRKYTPHVTLAAMTAPDLAPAIGFTQRLALFEARPFQVDRIGLYSSWLRAGAPSLYRLEAEYPLLG